MERNALIEKLTIIFKNVFNDNTLILSDSLTANDVDNWDSLTHMLLITEIENMFSIKFKLKELNKLKNVGDMIDMIAVKLTI